MIELACTYVADSFSLVVNEKLPSSGITAIFGRSGSGKTTLINLISGLLTPTSGFIQLNDQLLFSQEQHINIPTHRRNIGYVFQDARLFPHMTVERNLRYGQRKKNMNKFNEINMLLGIEQFLTRYPHELSGGEKQRVAIGRVLLSEPDILIMDEPTASLDAPRRQELINYLLKLTQKLSIPVYYVSHNLSEIAQLADHMLLLEQGKVMQNDALDVVWRSEFMRPWLQAKEQSRLVKATVLGQHPRYALTELKIDEQSIWLPKIKAEIGSLLRLRIYANDISIACEKPKASSIRNVLPAVIESIDKGENAGLGCCHVSLCIGKQSVIASITEWALDELQLKEQQQVFAQIKGVSISKQDAC